MSTKPKPRRPSLKALEKLPDKPSALLAVALRELGRAERDPKCVIDMGTYHQIVDGKCAVCLAGAVMRIAVSDDESIGTYGFHAGIGSKLRAINCFRMGYVAVAYRLLGRDRPPSVEERIHIASYVDSPAEFKRGIRRLMAVLKDAGE